MKRANSDRVSVASVQQRSEAIALCTASSEVEPSPAPLTLKEKVLTSFITAGINERVADDFLSQCEAALPMDSDKNWILRFIREQHELISETKPDLLTDTAGYFEALGFDHTPSVDPEIWKYETLINVAILLIHDSLAVITCQLGDNVPLDTWTLVPANSVSATNGSALELR